MARRSSDTRKHFEQVETSFGDTFKELMAEKRDRKKTTHESGIATFQEKSMIKVRKLD